MRTPEEFDEIRPYDPEELPAVFQELTADPEFQAVASHVMPGVPYQHLCQQLQGCHTNLEVQKTFFYPLLHELLARCSKGFRLDSTQLQQHEVPHTFITNHRDIVLDSAFLSIALIDNGFNNTVEIAIGDNLLIRPWIKQLVRINKSFIVQRAVGIRQMLASSARLSRYMHYAIAQKGENIWIAQREGRAKDSNDRTQDAILKMMAMGGEGTPLERLKALRLTPVALSYEYDPCDWLKAKEFQQKRDVQGFKKSPEDDLMNMKTGIFGFKGRICFRMANCINDWLDTLPADLPKGEFYTEVAQHIDREIHRNYELYAINYVAADLLKGTNDFYQHYTPEEKQAFADYIESRVELVDLEHPDKAFLRERMLTMYANPVFNHQAALP